MSFNNRSAAVLGELVVLVTIPIAAAFIWDQYLASWFGFEPTALCSLLGPIVNIAGSLGVLITSSGIVAWTLSRFRSDLGIQMIIGGVLLFVVPATLPHYLGAACISSP